MPPALTFVHPDDHTPLVREHDAFRALSGERFPDVSGVPCFVPQDVARHMAEERAGFLNRLKTTLRGWPRLYLFLVFLISPVCYSGLSAQRFLKRCPKGSLMLNIGSGVHRPHPDAVNVDIFHYPGVNLIANAEHLPLETNSVDAIVCESLLEHVLRPETIVAELYRVLKPGGRMYLVIPFVYPFHASPNDFYRWSAPGFRELLREGIVEEIGVRAGPTSGLVGQLGTWFSIAFSFGYEPLYNVLSLVGLLLFCPFKFLDWIIGLYPTAIHGAGQFYGVARKRWDW